MYRGLDCLDNAVGQVVYGAVRWLSVVKTKMKKDIRTIQYPVIKTSKVSKGAKKNFKQLTRFYI